MDIVRSVRFPWEYWGPRARQARRDRNARRECERSEYDETDICVRAVRLNEFIRRDLALLARTNHTASADSAAIRGLARKYLTYEDQVETFRGGDLPRLLALVSSVRPDYIELPLSVASRIPESALVRSGGNAAFRNVPVVVRIGEDTPEHQARCRSLGVTECIPGGLGRALNRQVISSSIVRQRRRVNAPDLPAPARQE